ncbi:MAG: MFS transporter [Burkholderiaceae bacterium]
MPETGRPTEAEILTPEPQPPASAPSERVLWTMLLALTATFGLSQAYRTVAAIMGPPLQHGFDLSPQQLGSFAAIFHFAFGGLQLLMGIGVDTVGVRRTVLMAFPLTIAGALLSCFAPGFGWLLLGQALIGIGCAPAFLACTVFIARRYPAERFAAVSGNVLAIGGIGMLMTGTPLAWLIETTSWRVGFAVLAGLSALAWLAVLRRVHEPAGASPGRMTGETLASALHGFARLFTLPHTWSILALGAVSYAAFVSLRGLWLGPVLVERHGFSLVAAGHVAFVTTLVALAGTVIFGRLDPGPALRRRRIVACALLYAGCFALMAANLGPVTDIAAAHVLSLLGGFIVLQYSDVHASYPPELTGRALSLFTMSMFLGVALMQWLTGATASFAARAGWPVYDTVFVTITVMVLAGTAAFRWLPQPRQMK